MFIVIPRNDDLVQGKLLWTGIDKVGKKPVGRITVSEGQHKGKQVFVYLTDVLPKLLVRKGDVLRGEIRANGRKKNGRVRFLLKKPQLV